MDVFINIIALILLACTTQVLAKEVIKIDGGAAPIQNIFRKIEIPFELENPNYDLILLESGADVALKNLDENKIDIATAGLNPEDWQKLSKKNNHSIRLADFQFRAIGRDVITVYLSPDMVTIKSLSNAQLEDIFTGKITNWKDISGPDLKITVVLGNKIPGTMMMFKQYIFPQSEYTKSAIFVEDVSSVQKKISQLKGAIGIGNNTLLVSNLLTPSIPEIGRQIYSATKGKPADKVRLLLEYIHRDGVKYIKGTPVPDKTKEK